MTEPVATTLIYHTDAYLRTFEAQVVTVEPGDGQTGQRIVLDRTAFYATSGGQPHDTGTLQRVGEPAATWQVTEVKRASELVWHTLEGAALPVVGEVLQGTLDWERRHRLMRTHTALHILCGVIWRDFQAPVTGGNMDTEEGRLDFELRDFSNEMAQEIINRVNQEIAADRPIEVRSLPRAEAFAIPDLIRTKVNLLPEGISEIRTVNIVGLDLQADGGTHVASTAEVGRVVLRKTRSKGANNKRIIIAVE